MINQEEGDDIETQGEQKSQQRLQMRDTIKAPIIEIRQISN
jgi:hypothetical protein